MSAVNLEDIFPKPVSRKEMEEYVATQIAKTDKAKEFVRYESIFLTVALASLTGLLAWTANNLNVYDWHFWLGAGAAVILFLFTRALHLKITLDIKKLPERKS